MLSYRWWLNVLNSSCRSEIDENEVEHENFSLLCHVIYFRLRVCAPNSKYMSIKMSVDRHHSNKKSHVENEARENNMKNGKYEQSIQFHSNWFEIECTMSSCLCWNLWIFSTNRHKIRLQRCIRMILNLFRWLNVCYHLFLRIPFFLSISVCVSPPFNGVRWKRSEHTSTF